MYLQSASPKNVITLYQQFRTTRIPNRNDRKLCQGADFMLEKLIFSFAEQSTLLAGVMHTSSLVSIIDCYSFPLNCTLYTDRLGEKVVTVKFHAMGNI